MNILRPVGDDIKGILHQYTFLNATCQASSNKHENEYTCIDAITVTKNTHFCSGNEEGQWFLFHIPNIKIFVTHYSLQMPPRSQSYWSYPKAWNFYGITEDEKEHPISHITEAGFDPNSALIRTFEIEQKGFYNKFKLVMEGLNDGSSHSLRIYKIDLFGKLYNQFGMCGTKHYYSHQSIFLFSYLYISIKI